MINRDFFQKYDEDNRFISYHPIKPLKVFGFELDSSECEINISQNLSLPDIASVLSEYLEWLSYSEKEVTEYFCSNLGEDVPEGWFESIEVFNASITFISLEDFGATVSFGESIFVDHIMEFTIDGYEIVDDGLIG